MQWIEFTQNPTDNLPLAFVAAAEGGREVCCTCCNVAGKEKKFNAKSLRRKEKHKSIMEG
jgi:hypothetical protein